MPNATWSATVGGNAISNIQDVSIRKGRTNLTENYRTGVLSMSGRRPDLLPVISIGDVVSVTMTFGAAPGNTATYDFRVSDLSIEYGIVAAQDTWTLTGEDAFGYAGRAAINFTSNDGSNALLRAQAVGTSIGVNVASVVPLPSNTTVSAQSLTDANALQILTNLINTEGGILDAGDDFIAWLPRNWQTAAVSQNFTDDNTGTFPVKYDRLQFSALADTAVTKVIVEPAGLAAQSSGTGTNVYTVQTYSRTTTDAADVAAFLAGSLTVTKPQPTEISLLLNDQVNNRALTALNIGSGINVKFRGTTYKTLILGTSITSNPSTTRISYHVVSADFYEYLVLDDPVFGKLNENKLGW